MPPKRSAKAASSKKEPPAKKSHGDTAEEEEEGGESTTATTTTERTNQPLTEDEALRAADRLLDVLEGATATIPRSMLYAPIGKTKRAAEQREASERAVWQWVFSGIGRDVDVEQKQLSIDKIKALIVDGIYSLDSERRYFLNVYQTHPRRPGASPKHSLTVIMTNEWCRLNSCGRVRVHRGYRERSEAG